MRPRHIVVSGVIAAVAALPTQAHAPGIILVDYAVGVRAIEVVAQGAGLFDLVAGLSISKAGESVVGERCRARAHHGESQKQFFESSHG
ncbi:hypothetical protein D3C86_1835760 [compost metagenome]